MNATEETITNTHITTKQYGNVALGLFGEPLGVSWAMLGGLGPSWTPPAGGLELS